MSIAQAAIGQDARGVASTKSQDDISSSSSSSMSSSSSTSSSSVDDEAAGCNGTELDVSGLGEGQFLQKAITEVGSFARVICACLRHDLDPGSAMNFRSVFDVDQ